MNLEPTMPTPMPPQLLLAPANFVRLNGLWKTTNRGHTWRNVFSDQAVSTFGDVAIALSDGSEGATFTQTVQIVETSC